MLELLELVELFELQTSGFKRKGIFGQIGSKVTYLVGMTGFGLYDMSENSTSRAKDP